ncbi:MAG: hypothetical protein ACAH11_02585 [Sphingomonas sp.]
MRKLLILAAALLWAVPAAAQDDGSQNPTIVVTGQSLADSERALRDCIARNCPPDEEAAATIAHAENQFVAGDYKAARATLLRGSGRLKRHGREYPVPVSDLLRANSRVAAHLGEGEAYRVGALDVLATLKSGLGEDDPRVLVARVEVADSLAQFGRFDLAEQRYNDVIRQARRLNLPVVEGFAMLRIASMRAQMAEEDPSKWRKRAYESIDALINSPKPEHKPFARAASVLRTRLAVQSGDKAAVDRMIADMRSHPTSQPVLLYAESIKPPQQSGRAGANGSVTMRGATQDFDDQWVDISFWVSPDGTTTDVDVLRQSDHFDSAWAAPIMASIRTRRYAPLKLDPSDPGILRVERYTLTSRWTTNTGSRLRDREATPRIEMLDLSAEDPAAAKPAQ